MRIKTLIIALIVSIGLFTACGDKKKLEEKSEKEIRSKENVDKSEVRGLDSIRQVKEHGHAH